MVSAFSPFVERIVDEVKRPVLSRMVSFGGAFHEMDFPLVLSGLGALPGLAFTRESHVPAIVFGVLQRGVVVLQDDFCEDAVFPVPVFLQGRGFSNFKNVPTGPKGKHHIF